MELEERIMTCAEEERLDELAWSVADSVAGLKDGRTDPRELAEALDRLLRVYVGDEDAETDGYLSSGSIHDTALYFARLLLRKAWREDPENANLTELRRAVRACMAERLGESWDEEDSDWLDDTLQDEDDPCDGSPLQFALLDHITRDNAMAIMYFVDYLCRVRCVTVDDLAGEQIHQPAELTLDEAAGYIERFSFQAFCYSFLEESNLTERGERDRAVKRLRDARDWSSLLMASAHMSIWMALDVWPFPYATWQMLMGQKIG